MIKCLIVDDEEMARKSIERLCQRIEDVEVVGCCESAIEALRILKEFNIDLLFLDIEMPEFSGLDLVKTVDRLPHIIFTTNNLSYAYEAFQLQVVDYMAKPVVLPRLMQAIEKVRKNQMTTTPVSDAIFVRSEGQYVRIALDQLLWVETVGDYVMFRTSTDKHVVHGTLKGMDSKLKSDSRFLKVHRSYIINLEHVDNIDETTAVIGQKVIPVSRAHRSILMKRISLI